VGSYAYSLRVGAFFYLLKCGRDYEQIVNYICIPTWALDFCLVYFFTVIVLEQETSSVLCHNLTIGQETISWWSCPTTRSISHTQQVWSNYLVHTASMQRGSQGKNNWSLHERKHESFSSITQSPNKHTYILNGYCLCIIMQKSSLWS
jgi:hypothetical protein